MKRMSLIVNPISGSGGDKAELVQRIVAALEQKEIAVDVLPTRGPGDATVLAREAVGQGVDAVLACGGDGTVNETATAMIGTGVPMGIIPCGSGNGLARHLAIPVEPMLSLDIIAGGHFDDCDCGMVNGRPFFCTFGVGYDADVALRFANSGRRGVVSYVRSAIEEFIRFRHEHYTLTVDGETIADDAFLITCCNISQYGNNAYIAPKASITDGLLDLIIIRKASMLETMLVSLDLVTGTIDHNRLIDTARLSKAVIERSAPGSAHIDGEPVQLGERLEICCLKGALRLFTPSEPSQFRPLITPVEDLLRDATITIRNSLNI